MTEELNSVKANKALIDYRLTREIPLYVEAQVSYQRYR
jgi:hypothetical protein